MEFLTEIPLRLKTHNGEIKLKPGDIFRPKSEEAIRELLAEGKVKPVMEIMSKEYQLLEDWLHQFDLRIDELKETLPMTYRDIQDTTKTLMKAFTIDDLSGFQDALNRVKCLYTEALLKSGRRVKVIEGELY